MKLRFLGQTYSPTNQEIETIASENTACFLGQNYTINVPVKNIKSQSIARKYHGVIYSN